LILYFSFHPLHYSRWTNRVIEGGCVFCESGFVDRQFFFKAYRARDRLLAEMLGRSLTRLILWLCECVPGTSLYRSALPTDQTL
jgi:hypothetical protein